MTEKIFFSSQDGLKLSGIWHIPLKQTTKAVILAHGITVDKDEDNGVFIRLADLLAEKGIAVFRFDFRGNGESEGKSVDLTIHGELVDLDAAIQEVMKKGYGHIGLQGNSFGGGVATLYVAQHQKDIACLCLWNPCLDYNHTFLNPTLPWIKEKKDHMQKDFEEKGWTTLGSRKFIIGKQLFFEMANLHPHQEIRKIGIPLCIIHGDKDTYVPYEDSKKAIEGLRNASLITIKDGEHGFSDYEDQTVAACNQSLKFFQKYL